MDMKSAKSDVNGPKETRLLTYFNLKKSDKNTKNFFKNFIDPNFIELNLSFKKNLNDFCHIRSHFNLTLDFSVRLSVQYTLNTLYLTHKKHKHMLQKRIDPNCTMINFRFHYFKNGFSQIKSDFNLKSPFLALYVGHKGQSRVFKSNS